MSFEKGVREQTLGHLLETHAQQREEGPRDRDVISWLAETGVRSSTPDGHRTRNVSHRHLIGVLLNFDLLKLDELRSTGLQRQSTTGLVRHTILTGTHDQWHEGGRENRLIGLRATDVTGVSGDADHRFHFGGPCHHTFDRDQLADVIGLHLPDGEMLLSARWFEV